MPLKGSCNRCGNCCVLGAYRCVNLLGKIGEKTTCAVYDKRFPDMPIWMVSPSGAAIRAYCMHDTGYAEEQVLTRLVREGKCSYEEDSSWLISRQLQPGASTPKT